MKSIKEFAEKVEPYLVEFFEQQDEEIPSEMLENIKDFCLHGGKRLRPALVYYGYKLFNKEDSPDVFRASLITELVHAFLLIHDDVMDQSDLRRNKPTIHKIYEKEAGKLKLDGDIRHYGESLGVLAGDLTYVLALKLLCSLNLDEKIKLAVLKKINNTIIQTIYGQELDIRLEFQGHSKPEDVIEVYRSKTAQYTIEAPLHIGAMLAGVDEFKKLSSYAIPCGIAFQIKDDILGVFGNEDALGKSVTSDLEQGKQTLLVAKALEKGIPKEKIFSKNIEEARKTLREAGVLADCQKLAEEYIKQAKQALKQFEPENYNQSVVKTLEEIADFIIQREV